MSRLYKVLASVLLGDSPLADFDEASCHVWDALWRDLCGKELKVASSWKPTGKLRSNNQERTESCQQPYELGSSSFPSWAFRWDLSPSQHFDCSLVRDPKDLARSCLDSTHRNHKAINVCCFTPLPGHMLHSNRWLLHPSNAHSTP